MSVNIRKALQGLALALPLVVVTGQMPAMAAPAAAVTPLTSCSNHVVTTAEIDSCLKQAVAMYRTPTSKTLRADAPPLPTAPDAGNVPAPTAPNAGAAPQAESQNPAGATKQAKPDIDALDLKEDIAQICFGNAVKLPFKIGDATTLRELLIELKLTDVLTEVCGLEALLAAELEKLLGPDGLLDLGKLLH